MVSFREAFPEQINKKKKTHPEDGVGVERDGYEEQLCLVDVVSQDLTPSQIHRDDGPAQLEQRKETPDICVQHDKI